MAFVKTREHLIGSIGLSKHLLELLELCLTEIGNPLLIARLLNRHRNTLNLLFFLLLLALALRRSSCFRLLAHSWRLLLLRWRGFGRGWVRGGSIWQAAPGGLSGAAADLAEVVCGVWEVLHWVV